MYEDGCLFSFLTMLFDMIFDLFFVSRSAAFDSQDHALVTGFATAVISFAVLVISGLIYLFLPGTRGWVSFVFWLSFLGTAGGLALTWDAVKRAGR